MEWARLRYKRDMLDLNGSVSKVQEAKDGRRNGADLITNENYLSCNGSERKRVVMGKNTR